MKTKHLFFAAALMTSFAACTSEDFIMEDMQMTTGTRPVVGNVKLNFGANDAQTRVLYDSDKGYQWLSSDVIGALLMDEVKSVSPTTPWENKYTLTKFIHTSFPFTYSDGSWGCKTKMLEGNYFFAAPWEDYDGNRQVSHSLLDQKQTGVDASVRATSYADNQFFVGYSQIKAGTKDYEVLDAKKVEMTPMLGAIQFQITNAGTKDYHINKIVLSGNDAIAGTVTIDPTNAKYSGYNTNDNGTIFNYANYVDDKSATFYNADANYKKIDAIRATVGSIGTEKSAQLTIGGDETQRALVKNSGNTAYALIMCNPIASSQIIATNNSGSNKKNGLKLSIYTDEGMAAGIDLTVEGEKYDVVTSSVVKAVGPNVINTIGIQLDDNSFKVPENMDIYNTSDLEQYIKWNKKLPGTRNVSVNLRQNIELPNSVAKMLLAEDNKNTTLTFIGETGASLILGKDVPANFFESEKVTAADLSIVLNGEMNLTEKTESFESIAVAAGAELSINDPKADIPATIVNAGTIEMGADAVIPAGKKIDNKVGAEITLALGGDCKANIENAGTIVNSGFMKNGSINNNNGGVIEVKGTGNIVIAENKLGATVKTSNGAQVDLSNKNSGELVYVSGAKVYGFGGSGVISNEFAGGTLDNNTFKIDENTIITINKLILTTGKASVNEDLTYKNIEVCEGVEIAVKSGKTLKATTLDIIGSATTSGAIEVGEFAADSHTNVGGRVNGTGNMTVEEGAAWTNNGTTKVNGYLTNEGTIINNNTIKVGEFINTGVWKYNSISENWPVNTQAGPAQPKLDEDGGYNDKLDAFVRHYMNTSNGYPEFVKSGDYATAVGYENMKKAYNTYKASGTTVATDLYDKANGKDSEGVDNGKIYNVGTSEAPEYYPFNASDLSASVNRIESEGLTALKNKLKDVTFAQINTLFEDILDKPNTTTVNEYKSVSTQLVELFKNSVLANGTYTGTNFIATAITNVDNDVLAAVNDLGSTEILAYLHEDCAVVYAGCPVETILKIWIANPGIKGLKDDAGNPVDGNETFVPGTNSGQELFKWAVGVLTSESTSTLVKSAREDLEAAEYVTIPDVAPFKGYSAAQLNVLSETFK